MYVLRAYIKFSIFGNIFLKIEKAVITFLIFEIFFLKIKINGHTLIKSYRKKLFLKKKKKMASV